jgi:chromosome segregation ATPase
VQQLSRNTNQQQKQLGAAESAASQAQALAQELQRDRAHLEAQLDKHRGDAEFLQGELAGLRQQTGGLRKQVAVQQEQVRVAWTALCSGACSSAPPAPQHCLKGTCCSCDSQLATARQEVAVKAAALSHASTALQEHRGTLAHTRSQCAAVQDNLSGQLRALQRELAAVQAEKQQSDRDVGRLTHERE